MKKILIILLFSIQLSATVYAQPSKHVILVSIDGFRPDFYLDKTWPTPNIQNLAQEGVTCLGVVGVMPTSTYPSHTSIITGTNPIKHGIYYNTDFSVANGNGEWHTSYYDIKVESLWQAAKRNGLTTASISWPVSVGAPIDYNIPEIWSKTNSLERRTASSEYATPKGLFEELLENATGKLSMEDYNLTSLSFDDNLSRMAAYLIRTYKPNLLTIHLPCVDGAQHKEGLNGKMVTRSIAGADHAISTIIDAVEKAGIKENTTIFIIGDHGFVGTHTAIAPNIWLQQNGIVYGDPSTWSCRFISAGGSCFFHLKNVNDKETLKKVKQMLLHLPASQQKLFKLLEKEEVIKLGGNSEAEFALAAIPGIMFNNNTNGELIRSSIGGTHGYTPDMAYINSGVVVSGAGVPKGAVVNSMNLNDLAPTIAYLLGFEFNNVDGMVVPAIIVK
ncbi:MAG: alkaline phosphatase family protein [Prevotellaceae bacterium]|jgi:predicted AlkP superfamily pyrophosphatase or phosphodiesterase|nr:alkaline phosphatase family protein [Prevotellaceae bacterium]